MLVNKYPLDLTGVSPDNFIPGEVHDLVDNGRDGMRVFVPNYGAFFTQGMILRDALGAELRPNDDYIATYLYEDPTHRSGLEVCGAVIVLNPNVASPVYLDYQVVGGDFAVSSNALEQVLQTLQDDDRPVVWANIIGKPSTYPAGGHLHALWELYGFEYMVAQLERITQAIVTGDQAMFDETRAYAFSLFEDSKGYTDELDQRFQDHTNNTSNPHQVTKTQVGLGNVDNYPSATLAEIETGTATDRFVTVHGLLHGIDFHIGSAFGDHLADISNPHSVTKAQVGLGNVDNFLTATQPEAEGGTRNDRFMTPLRTAEAITEQAGTLLDAHIDDKTNPHEVTKAQVGLGNVENYPIATSLEAQEASLNTRFMTPLRTRDAFGPLFQEHVTNGFIIPRTGTTVRIDIPAAPGNNDPAYIEHRDNGNNASLFRFSCSDDPSTGSADQFQFGGGTSSNWNSWLTVNSSLATFNHNVSANDVYIRSDRRSKTDIERLQEPLAKLGQLGGYLYRMLKDGSPSAGLIAQEVQQVLPQSVTETTDEEGTSRLNLQLGGPIALLVESVNQLHGLVTTQQAELDRLRLVVDQLSPR